MFFKKTKHILDNLIKIEKNKERIRALVRNKERYKMLLDLIDIDTKYETVSIDERNDKIKKINIKMWELDNEIFKLEKENLQLQNFFLV